VRADILRAGQFGRRIKSHAIIWLAKPGAGWRMAGFGLFLVGLAVGAGLDDLALGLALASFIVLTPLLLLAALLYDFQTATVRVLPGFKTLLVLMLICALVLQIFALGTLAFASSTFARITLLLAMSGAIAWAIFAEIVRAKQPEPAPAAPSPPLPVSE
jgi:hypothetical protein